MRKPNTKCSVCQTPLYRSPAHLTHNRNIFCSGKCQRAIHGTAKTFMCDNCGMEFKSDYGKKPRKYCSRRCSNVGRTGIKYNKLRYGSSSYKYLLLLSKTFNFTNCMIDGCTYNNTYDVHRFIPGKNGGKYIIGNMFAICPNHHAEIHRGIITVEKVNDCKLQIRNRWALPA
jgi:endogenous inhibitor of DNA gyrase (YacG/DUF329 family)